MPHGESGWAYWCEWIGLNGEGICACQVANCAAYALGRMNRAVLLRLDAMKKDVDNPNQPGYPVPHEANQPDASLGNQSPAKPLDAPAGVVEDHG